MLVSKFSKISKNDLIKAVKIDKWKKELDKIYLTDKPMG